MSDLQAKKSALFSAKPVAGATAANASKPVSKTAALNKTTTSSSSQSSSNQTSLASKTGATTSQTKKASGPNLPNISPAVKAKKIAEAQEYSAKGMAHLKTSVFQWSPDHLAAAGCFENSAKAYKAANELDLARLMMVKCADSNEECGCDAAAAQALMIASEYATDLNMIDTATDYLQRGADIYALKGNPDKAADLLFRAGKVLESSKPDKALGKFNKAINLLYPKGTPEAEIDKIHPSIIEMIRHTFKFLLAHDKLQLALEFAETRCIPVYEAFEQESSTCKTMAIVVILNLSLGDVVQANNKLLEYFSNSFFLKSGECRLVDNLVQAFRLSDISKLDEAMQSHELGFLDPREAIALVKMLSLFGAPEPIDDEMLADQLASNMRDLMAIAGEQQPTYDEKVYLEGESGGGEEDGREGGVVEEPNPLLSDPAPSSSNAYPSTTSYDDAGEEDDLNVC